MENKKVLGKIEKVEFGMLHDKPYIFGLFLNFSLGSTTISDSCQYSRSFGHSMEGLEPEDMKAICELMYQIKGVLEDANVNTIDELVGIPVEVNIGVTGMFQSFRILTEVL